MDNKLDAKRTWMFIGIAFSIAWTVDLVIYLTGGLTQVNIGSRAWILLLSSMAAPALANILTRLITHEGWGGLYLRPRLRHGWRYWLAAWIGTPLLLLLGVALFFAIFPAFFDPSLSAVKQLLAQKAQTTGHSLNINPWIVIMLQVIQGIILAPIINGLATLGEEFGWRAYLLPKLMPLGSRKALALTGITWGIWHWPVIAMGYNYGLDYPGAPWLGLLCMVWFTFVAGIFLGWLAIEANSVWPAVIGHAAINDLGAIGYMAAIGHPSALLGPTPAGLIASIPFSIVALWLLWRMGNSRSTVAAVRLDVQVGCPSVRS